MSNGQGLFPWAGIGVFCVFPLHHGSPGLTLQTPPLPKSKRDTGVTGFLFDLHGKLGKSLHPFASAQGIIQHAYSLPSAAGRVLHEFIHEEIP